MQTIWSCFKFKKFIIRPGNGIIHITARDGREGGGGGGGQRVNTWRIMCEEKMNKIQNTKTAYNNGPFIVLVLALVEYIGYIRIIITNNCNKVINNLLLRWSIRQTLLSMRGGLGTFQVCTEFVQLSP